MIDSLVAAALVGTARQPDPPWATGTPVDDLVAALPGCSSEQAILLAAGAADLYRRAGTVPATRTSSLPICPPETRPKLDVRSSQLLADLLGGKQPLPDWASLAAGNRINLSPADLTALLPEAFRLVDALGCHLPHTLLPQALDLKAPAARSALLPILGERGRWLAALNTPWQWATKTPSGWEAGELEAAEHLWQEGTAAQRRAVLVQLRATAQDTARQWLAEAWKGEKPDSRLELLTGLGTGLSPADQPFLEQALRDRVEKVRDQAAALLLLLPDSRLRAQLTAVADTCLSRQAPTGRLQGLTGMLGERGQRGTLEVRLPSEAGIDWASLGIGEPPKSAESKGRGAWYLSRLLSRVPPSHWSERFEMSPENMIAAAQSCAWDQVLFEAWSEAAILHGDQTWIKLFVRLWASQLKVGSGPDAARGLGVKLLRSLLPEAEDREIAQLLTSGDPASIQLAVEAKIGMDGEWGTVQSRAFVEMIKTLPGRIPASAPFGREPWMAAVLQALPWAARCLSPGSLDGVPRRWDLPDHLKTSSWSRALASLSDTVNMRRHMRQTLTAPADECRSKE
jgi:hypothetical protein